MHSPTLGLLVIEVLNKVDVFRFLQAEAETLQQMQSRISNELHHLQVRIGSVYMWSELSWSENFDS